MPDISTAQNFRQAMLSAKSLVYSDPKSGAASGVAIAQFLDKLGIADQVKSKTTLITTSVGEVVVQGKAELGAQQMSELLAVKGIAIPLCVNNSETSSPSTISVGAEKDSHLHEQDQW